VSNNAPERWRHSITYSVNLLWRTQKSLCLVLLKSLLRVSHRTDIVFESSPLEDERKKKNIKIPRATLSPFRLYFRMIGSDLTLRLGLFHEIFPVVTVNLNAQTNL